MSNLARIGEGEDDAGAALRAAVFTDIFFSETGRCFLRGVPDSDGPLTAPPPETMADISIIHQIVCERGAREHEFSLDFGGMRFRVSRIDAEDGHWYTLRRAMWPIPRVGTLRGIPAKVLQQLALLGADGKYGLILFCGGTGEGKTTTACSLLVEYLIGYGNVAVTVEDPIELPMNGPHGNFGHCFQTELRGSDYATEMKKTMRRSPRYILLGEVRGSLEASQVLRAAVNGHVVISTIHAGSCIEGLDALLKFVAGAEPIDLARNILAQGLAAVIHQRLIKSKDANGKHSVSIVMEWLFPGNDSGIRSLIRSGKTEQLTTAIKLQANRVTSGQLPVA